MQCHVLARYCTLQRTGGIRGGAARRGGRLGGSEPTAFVGTSSGLPDALHFGTLRAGHFQRRAKRGSGGGLWPTVGRGATARAGGRVKRLKRGEGGASGGVVGGSLLFALAGDGLIN